jgi:hypothetical protein
MVLMQVIRLPGGALYRCRPCDEGDVAAGRGHNRSSNREAEVMKRHLCSPSSLFAAAIAAAALAVTAAPAAAQRQTRVGTLSCDVSAGVGLIIFQRQDLNCTFKPARGGSVSRYVGHIADYGVALGGVTEGYLVWGVIARTRGVAPGSLAGTYAGVGAQASAGLGAGVNVLVGGSGRAFSLQPLSVQGQIGVNVAAGITSLTLTAAP